MNYEIRRRALRAAQHVALGIGISGIASIVGCAGGSSSQLPSTPEADDCHDQLEWLADNGPEADAPRAEDAACCRLLVYADLRQVRMTNDENHYCCAMVEPGLDNPACHPWGPPMPPAMPA